MQIRSMVEYYGSFELQNDAINWIQVPQRISKCCGSPIEKRELGNQYCKGCNGKFPQSIHIPITREQNYRCIRKPFDVVTNSHKHLTLERCLFVDSLSLAENQNNPKYYYVPKEYAKNLKHEYKER